MTKNRKSTELKLPTPPRPAKPSLLEIPSDECDAIEALTIVLERVAARQ